MQILKIQQPNNYTYRNCGGVQKSVTFGQDRLDSFKRSLRYDAVDSVELTLNARLKCVYFKEGTNLEKALGSLAYTKNSYLEKLLIARLHPLEELRAIHNDMSKAADIAGIKIKSLMSMGCTALVFETEDGNILKVSPYNHFPHGRKPEDFDLPSFKSGKSGYTHYYLQEKVSQENLSQAELKEFIGSIEQRGYYLHDYTIKRVFGGGSIIDSAEEINPAQFGRAKNGKIYLIDPECAIPEKCKGLFKSSLCKKLKRFCR